MITARLGFALFVFGGACAIAAPAGQVDFAAEIQPVFRAYCYACHQGAQTRQRISAWIPWTRR